MKLGLKPARIGAINLQLATYCNFAQLPTPPANFGHEFLIDKWGMLGNDQWGDCALAGPAHQVMLWCKEGKTTALFDNTSVLKNYSAVTGFDLHAGPSGSNPTDRGTDMEDMARYWQKTGMVDAYGTRHKIAAYVGINPGDLRELWAATYLFQTIGLGFDMPQSALDQTEKGKPWDYVRGSPGVGGHYVPAVARRSGLGVGVSWGKIQSFSPKFYQHYNTQGIVAMSAEMIVRAKSIDGFDDQLLLADLQAFGK